MARRRDLWVGRGLVGLGVLLGLAMVVAVPAWRLVIPLLLVAGGLRMLARSLGKRAMARESATIPLGASEKTSIRLRHAGGHLSVAAGCAPTAALCGTFAGGAAMSWARSRGALEVELLPPEGGWSSWLPVPPWQGGADWDVRLNPDIPTMLSVETGAAQADLDLEDLLLVDLTLKTGASVVSLILPGRAGFSRVTIDSGMASVSVRVPPGVAADIAVQGGLATICVDEKRFPPHEGGFRSPDYPTAECKVALVVQAGMGIVDVR